MDFDTSIPMLPLVTQLSGRPSAERQPVTTMGMRVHSLMEDRIYQGCQIDEGLAALLELFRDLDFPPSPKSFLEDGEFYVAPRYLTSSLTKQDFDNLGSEAECHLAQKKYTKASKLFKEGCHDNHHDVRGWQGLGDCYAYIQKFGQARITYSIAGSINVTENLKNRYPINL